MCNTFQYAVHSTAQHSTVQRSAARHNYCIHKQHIVHCAEAVAPCLVAASSVQKSGQNVHGVQGWTTVRCRQSAWRCLLKTLRWCMDLLAQASNSFLSVNLFTQQTCWFQSNWTTADDAVLCSACTGIVTLQPGSATMPTTGHAYPAVL